MLFSIRTIILIVAVLFFSGCFRGFLYTNTVEPYCTNMQSTPIGERRSDSGIVTVSIPRLPGARTIWNSNAIGDAVKQADLEEVFYCDRERFSILGGIYGSDSLVVYGR
ncbi:hypothetical protein EBR25_03095 [bacterium]|nr:hypothetical protein [bacterium]